MAKHGFTRGSNSGIAIREFADLEIKIKLYPEEQRKILEQAISTARKETRNWIREHHPATAFNGKRLDEFGNAVKKDAKGQKYSTKAQFRLGHFGMIGHGGGRNGLGNGHADNGEISSLNIYANYFARWYATGVNTELWHGYRYSRPGNNWWIANRRAIEQHYLQIVERESNGLYKL